MSKRVPPVLRQAVMARAKYCCEYCLKPDNLATLAHEPDHIIADQHGGSTSLDNLAYACFDCNRKKGPNLASIDPDTGLVTAFFHPRTQAWDAHFRWNGGVIEPLTAVGRATANFFEFNHPRRVMARENWFAEGKYPRSLHEWNGVPKSDMP